jgi:hypothetical protein
MIDGFTSAEAVVLTVKLRYASTNNNNDDGLLKWEYMAYCCIW